LQTKDKLTLLGGRVNRRSLAETPTVTHGAGQGGCLLEKWKTHIGIFVAYVSCRDEVSDECANFATVVTRSSNTMMMNSLIDFVFEKKLSRFYMTWPDSRGSPLTTMQRLLITLRFLATGSMQRVVGDIFGVTVSTACCTINKTVRVLASLKGRLIIFPTKIQNVTL